MASEFHLNQRLISGNVTGQAMRPAAGLVQRGGGSTQMIHRKRLYQVYLVRMWRETHEGEWFAQLQDITSGECRNFQNLTNLFDYMRVQTETTRNQKLPLRKQNDSQA